MSKLSLRSTAIILVLFAMVLSLITFTVVRMISVAPAVSDSGTTAPSAEPADDEGLIAGLFRGLSGNRQTKQSGTAVATPVPVQMEELLLQGKGITSNTDLELSEDATDADLAAALQAAAARPINAPYTIYKNALAKGWEDLSIGANVNFSGFPAYDGQTAIITNFSTDNGSVYLHSPEPILTENYNLVRFWINGGVAGGQQLSLALVDENNNALKNVPIRPPYANNWRQIDILIEDLGDPRAIRGLIVQDELGEAQPPFYIDELALVDDPLAGLISNQEPDGPVLTVDTINTAHEINPLIYGMSFAEESVAKELDLPLNRWGGNAVSRYNFVEDSTNSGNNWFFQNHPAKKPSQDLPRGSSADKFVQQNNRSETDSFMTIPMLGWVARGDYACGFDVEKYGDQIETDEFRPECGNGMSVEGEELKNGDPNDTSIPAGPTFAQDWVRHLTNEFGVGNSEKGVQFYGLDNEPFIWSQTHRDIHPEPVSYDELWEKTIAYAPAIKQVDPTAQIAGPSTWGWTSYFWSSVDWWDGNDPLVSAPDREAHGGLPFTAWYLQQMAAYEQQTGTRLLDYLDLHYYPQTLGVAFADTGNETIQSLRLRSTRSLWDPTYVDESWIDEPVYLIPRMREWVNTYYPGTKLAIGEYNFGAMDNVNGAVTQADVLGIFGREQLDMAALFEPPKTKEPGMFAFRMFLNYDGKHAKFGDLSLSAESANQDQISVYAARRSSDNVLTVTVINKAPIVLTSELLLEGLADGDTANVFRYGSENVTAIERLEEQTVENGRLVDSYPPASITLYEFGASSDTNAEVTVDASADATEEVAEEVTDAE